jgi:hypothetical protein
MAASDTPTHPDCRGGEAEWVNTERALVPLVDTKTVAIIEERSRYAALTAERLPTPAEVSAHVAEIDRIREGR